MGRMKHLAVDTMVLIYLIEGNSPFTQKITHQMEAAEKISLSSLGLGEVLTGLEKKNDLQGKLKLLSFIETYKKIVVLGFGKQEALIFAKLRAKYPQIKSPDAIHLATAISARANGFLTNDKALNCVTEIQVTLLD